MKVSKDFGIVVRRAALEDRAINLCSVMNEFHLDEYFDESEEFISLGPFFGKDNADNCMNSLVRQGLVYIDDFFILEGYFPEWCTVEVFRAGKSS